MIKPGAHLNGRMHHKNVYLEYTLSPGFHISTDAHVGVKHHHSSLSSWSFLRTVDGRASQIHHGNTLGHVSRDRWRHLRVIVVVIVVRASVVLPPAWPWPLPVGRVATEAARRPCSLADHVFCTASS